MISGSAKRLNKNGSTSSSVSGPPKFNNKTPTRSSFAFRICEFQSMETEVVAFSNAVAAETTFLLEEEEEEEENVRTSRERERVFCRRRPPRPSPSSPLSHLRATLYTTSFVSRTPVFCCRLFCCFSRRRSERRRPRRCVVVFLLCLLSKGNDCDDDVEQEVDDDDDDDGVDALIVTFYVCFISQNLTKTAACKIQLFCFFAIFAIQFLVKKRQKRGRRV